MSAPRNLLPALLATVVLSTHATASSASIGPSPSSSFIGPPEFTSRFHSLLLGENPRSVAIADMNGDGKADLICAGNDSATILLGNGWDEFQPVQRLPVRAPNPAAVGDVNGDGYLDLALADPAAGHVTLYLGDGIGHVGMGTDYAAGTRPTSVVFADLDSDGNLDLVSSNDSGVAIRLGLGGGSFGPELDVPVAGAPAFVESGDLNGDGIPDLVVGGAAVYILIGNGDGTFRAGVSIPKTAPQFVLSDVSGDGHPDLVVPGGSVSVWYGAGDGTFPAHIDLQRTSTWPFASVAVTDVNRDGIPDIVAAAPGEDYDAFPPPNRSVSIFLGFGQGSFYSEVTTAAAGAPTFVASGDLNGDGSSDLVVTNVAAKVFSVYLTNGDATFGLARDFACGSAPYTIETADFNRDGRMDLATSDHDGGVSILLGRGGGDLQPATSVPLGSGALALKPLDMNQDGCPDLVVARTDGGVQALIGRCDGSFQTRPASSVGSYPVAIDVADFNEDGVPDVIVAHSGAVSLLIGAPDGSFGPPKLIDPNVSGENFGAVAAGDFNADGHADIVYAVTSAWIVFRPGRGDGSFGGTVGTPMPHMPLAIAAGDVNRDGRLDIVSVEPRLGNVLLGNGDGTFAPGVDIPLPRDPVEARVVDLDGDAIPDLVAASPFSNLVSVLHGFGDGTFAPAECFGAGVGVASSVAADFDGDGRGDLAVANVSSNSVSVLLNRTVGAGPLPARAFLSDPRALVVGAGRSEVCLNVEPIGQEFSRADVGTPNPVLLSDGAGSVTSITGYLLAPGAPTDADGNGVPDFPVCFRRDDLARLFDRVNGWGTVPATLQGTLTSGRAFRALVSLAVAAADGPLHATVSPNPTNPFSVLSFATTAAGWVRVELFDAGGRLVRTETERAAPGYHAYVLNGWNGSGGRMASGVYFVRIRTEHDGEQRLRFVMLR